MRLKFLAIAALSSAMAFFAATPSRAVPLVDQGSITYDPNTGLRWLDLTQTQGMSFNQTLNSPYVTTDGFRFATPLELQSLYADVGITNYDSPNHSFSEDNAPWPAPDLDDTQLGESSLSLELHRAQIPDRRVPSL
jgi:hypothetical protein